MSCVHVHGGFVLGSTGFALFGSGKKISLLLYACACVYVCWAPRRGRHEAGRGQVGKMSDAR